MRHSLQLVHHSRGRVRLSVPSAKGKPKAMEEMRRMLSALPGVRDISTNVTIGSITVHYDPHHHEELKTLLAQSAPPPPPPRPPDISDMERVDLLLEKEAEFLASHSHAASAVMDSVKRLDLEIKRATGNAVDLKVMGPLVLAAIVFLELGVAASTPVWLTLSLFSINHFIELHSEPPTDSAPPPPEEESSDAAEPQTTTQRPRSRRKNPRLS